jgi:phospholipase A2
MLTMNTGMSNNLPIYPLLRDGRNIDVLIAFDASANIESENWLSVVDGYVNQRGIRGWPIGAGWPKEDVATDPLKADLDRVESASVQQAAEKIADIREERRKQANAKHLRDDDLGYCNVWIGTTMERESEDEPPQSKRVDSDAGWRLRAPDAGIAVIYFPFLPNPKVEGVDPNTSDFMSTWNFIYSPEEIEKVVSLARANFGEGKERTRQTIRAVYERKKTKRLEEKEKRRIRRWKHQLRESGDHFV